MKKKFLCLFLGIWLCLSFALPLYALDGTIIADDDATLVTPTLEMTTIPTGAAAIARNLDTNQIYYYRINGNILSNNDDEILSKPGWMPETASTNEIIGSDDRNLVSNTQTSPFCAIVFLEIHFPSGKTCGGTGVMISPNAVLTAAHNLYIYDKERDVSEWASSIQATPGVNGSVWFPNTPYGSSMATELVISIPYFETKDAWNCDWGVIRLADNIGNYSGFLGFQYIARNIAGEFPTIISGYPGDLNDYWDTRNQYMHSAMIDQDRTFDPYVASNTTSYQNRYFRYNTDATDGQSGAPILYYDNSAYVIIGIHSGGIPEDPDDPNTEYLYNVGFSLTYQVFSFLWSYT